MGVPRRCPSALLLMLAASVSARAQSAPNTYGTLQESYVHIPAIAFQGLNPGDAAHTTGIGGISGFVTRYGSGDSSLAAPLTLPSGALITSIKFQYCDLNQASNRSFLVLAVSNFEGYVIATSPFIYSEYGGCSETYTDVAADGLVVDNNMYAYHLAFYNNIGDGTEAIAGVVIGYRLQVSPAPAVPHFTDVPTDHPYFQFIEALYTSGITGGCGGGNYCPNNPVTRGQMAVFLAKALGLHFP
ncbi:MAG TPA: S-layer homology domain-containing protein [Thermoanaerobaculia bacterium]|nr:S-layer homology domain-containing protein [Thermoanaerobaculia bacterium]